ncbi:MAG: T9SS type A sorting domain-containing protein [Bacteroidales bacterium]|nr:T9SS type A sorting domain-containing protein [Bacteroidales bacterium]
MKLLSTRFSRLAAPVLMLAFTLVWNSLIAQNPYSIIGYIDAGNPGGLNVDRDDRTTGWTLVISGPQSANSWSTALSLPFPFEIYGQPVSQYRVSQNGLLTFNTEALGTPPGNNGSLPSGLLPDMTLAVFWDAFTPNPPTSNESDIYWKNFGTSPNRQFWVKWHRFEYSNYSWASYAVVFEESTNHVYFVDFSYNNGGPGTSTIGIQLDGSTAQQAGSSPSYTFNAGTRNIDDNDYFEFIPLPTPVAIPFSEDFSSCTWPSGWSQSSVGCTDRWSVSNSGNAGGAPCEMRADDQPGAGNGSSVLYMPPFITTGYTQLEVLFNHYFDDQGAGMTIGLSSSSDFVNWTQEWTASSGGGDLGPELISAVVNNNLGAITYLAFFLQGNMNNDFNSWNIDNVIVQEYQPCLTIPYTQDFNASLAWPAGWSTTDPNIWYIDPSWPGVAPPTGNHVYSDYSVTGTGTIYSPCFDGTLNSNIYVRFYHYWRADYPFGTQDGYFYGSPDGGTTVYLIDEWHHNTPGTQEGWKEYDISAWADGAGNILFAWVVDHNDDWYWVFDDFQIQEGPWGTPGLWTGLVDTDWSNTGNWSDLTVPIASVDVVIPAGCPNFPVVDEVAVANSIYIMDGADFTVTTGADITLNYNLVTGLSTGATLTINDGTLNAQILFILDGSFAQMNGGIVNLSADLYVGYGVSGEFELNGGDCNVTGNLYTTFGSITDINNGDLSFNNWYRSPTQVFSRGNVEISGGSVIAAGSVLFGGYDFTGVMDGPVDMIIGGTYRNLEANWTTTNGSVYMTGSSGLGPHYFMSSNFGAGNRGSAYNLEFHGEGLEFRSNPTGAIAGYHVYNNLSVIGGHVTTVGDPGYLNDNFLVGGNLNVSPLGSFTMNVTGSNPIGANLAIKSNGLGTGSWIDNGNTSVTGITSVQRYVTPDQWHYVSPPVSNALSGVFVGSYLRAWEEPNYAWGPYIVPTNIPLNVAQGYELWKAGSPQVFNYTGGTLNTGDIVANVTATDRDNDGGINWGDYEGWNFTGNPFPSAIDWNGSWTSTNIDPTVYIWDGNIGQYAEWNWFTGLGVNKADGIIPADQGFFVKANNFNPALTIPQGERLHSTQAFYKNSAPTQQFLAELLMEDSPEAMDSRSRGEVPVKVNRPGPAFEFQAATLSETGEDILKGGTYFPNHLRLTASGNGYSDEALVMFHLDATESFDNMFDAFKLTGIVAAPQLYSYISGEKMSMNCFPPVTGVRIVPLGFTVGSDGIYTITAGSVETFDDEYNIWLEDSWTGQLINLKYQPVYQFSSSSFDSPNRFRLHFTVEDIPSQEELKNSVADNRFEVYSFEKTVYVKTGEAVSGEIQVFNLLGQEVLSENFEGPIAMVNVPSGEGTYIVKVIAPGVSETRKIFLK